MCLKAIRRVLLVDDMVAERTTGFATDASALTESKHHPSCDTTSGLYGTCPHLQRTRQFRLLDNGPNAPTHLCTGTRAAGPPPRVRAQECRMPSKCLASEVSAVCWGSSSFPLSLIACSEDNEVGLQPVRLGSGLGDDARRRPVRSAEVL